MASHAAKDTNHAAHAATYRPRPAERSDSDGTPSHHGSPGLGTATAAASAAANLVAIV